MDGRKADGNSDTLVMAQVQREETPRSVRNRRVHTGIESRTREAAERGTFRNGSIRAFRTE